MIENEFEQINTRSKSIAKYGTGFLATLLIAFLSNCVSTQINDEFYRAYLTRDFNYPKDKVMQATLAALKTQKIGVEKIDLQKGVIVTERDAFYKQTTISGNQYYATAQSQVATHQYYLLVTGDKSRSTVQATRYRLWNNNIEQTHLNANWGKTNIWDPFFKEIQEKLEE
ncbi:hypothetical protein EHQ53_13610 [Leptospira langatensis]|uniref:Uncharacterized protein n=1 Tax=Leptospira langatensis TaxID=2484983 RepID=A0A5F1ZTN4_9LEPT|nr:hypothetical protein [Leptospira langatensis]TGK02597.1 hypothetical protein EHO57_04505 [Leptospira langatensis]TGL40202.1 hypothetical protein EHQ53_13610 [Leptospira langatensis]